MRRTTFLFRSARPGAWTVRLLLCSARLLLCSACLLLCSACLLLCSACAGTRLTSEAGGPPPGASTSSAPRVQRAVPVSDPYEATVAQLRSPEFETRARAARTLVAAGEAALPALGRAGDMPVRVDGGLQISATTAVVRALIAEAGDEALLDQLGSPWANVRREAAGELGRRDRWSAVPRLIDHLEDADPEVRAASASALRRVTNNFFGYRALASVGQRRRSADRWRSWWSQEGRAGERDRAFGAKAETPGGS